MFEKPADAGAAKGPAAAAAPQCTPSSLFFSFFLFSSLLEPPSHFTSAVKKTIATVFSEQLNDLVQAIHDTEPAYIRCLKPNFQKSPDAFDEELILKQLKASH